MFHLFLVIFTWTTLSKIHTLLRDLFSFLSAFNNHILSNSAKALITLKINLPVGVSSTNPIFKTCVFTPFSNNCLMILIPSTVDIVKRINFVTTNVSPLSMTWSNLLIAGRFFFVPVNLSLNIYSQSSCCNCWICPSKS